MSASSQPTKETVSESPEWASEEYARAAVASDFWFSMHAPEELIEQYRGMHVAVCVGRIVDADRDFNALARRLDALGSLPLGTILRYIPSADEPLRYR